jgi:hypothetical protein
MKNLLLTLPACAGLLLMTSCAGITGGGYSYDSSAWATPEPFPPVYGGPDQATLNNDMMIQQLNAQAIQTTSEAAAAINAAMNAAPLVSPQP